MTIKFNFRDQYNFEIDSHGYLVGTGTLKNAPNDKYIINISFDHVDTTIPFASFTMVCDSWHQAEARASKVYEGLVAYL